jgi:hypothetical protein
MTSTAMMSCLPQKIGGCHLAEAISRQIVGHVVSLDACHTTFNDCESCIRGSCLRVSSALVATPPWGKLCRFCCIML